MAPSLVRLAVLSAVGALLGCGGDNGGNGATGPYPYTNVPPPPGGVAAFSYAPVDLATSGTITPLGNLAPPGHVLPTDHAYIYAVDFDHPPAMPNTAVRPIVAPALGAVTFILHQPSNDWKIEFRATENFYFYLDHVAQLDASLQVGSIVQAGQQVGVTNPGGSIDVGAWDASITLTGFVNPKRYGAGTLGCVTPWRYFVEPLRSQIYARVRRAPTATPDARIDFDVAGTLAGNWFHESVPQTQQESSGPNGWPKSLSFAGDYYDPALLRVSIGGTIAPAGVWTIPDDAPRPAAVTPASGKVAYRLQYTGDRSPYGLMLLQLMNDTTLKVEMFVGSTAATGEFDAGAMIYIR